MRKLIVTTSLALVLAACGGSKEGTTKADVETPKAEVSGTVSKPDVSVAETVAETKSVAEETVSDTVETAENIAEDAGETVAEPLEDLKDAATDTAGDLKAAADDVKSDVEDIVEDATDSFDLAALPAPFNTADLDKGQKLFRQCASCHLVDESGTNRVGPNLHGVVGSPAGHVENFTYSKAMAESGIVWTPETVSAYIENPRAYVPGNKMSFAGLRKEEDRINVIAYIMSQGGYTAE